MNMFQYYFKILIQRICQINGLSIVPCHFCQFTITRTA